MAQQVGLACLAYGSRASSKSLCLSARCGVMLLAVAGSAVVTRHGASSSPPPKCANVLRRYTVRRYLLKLRAEVEVMQQLGLSLNAVHLHDVFEVS